MIGVWLLVTVVAGCLCFVVGDVLCARRNRIGPFWDDRLAATGEAMEGEQG